MAVKKKKRVKVEEKESESKAIIRKYRGMFDLWHQNAGLNDAIDWLVATVAIIRLDLDKVIKREKCECRRGDR